MTDAILSLNAGSSSLKFAVFEIAAAGLKLACRGQIEGIGGAARFAAHDGEGAALAGPHWPAGAGNDALLPALLDWIDHHLGGNRLIAAGHRVVHGGADHSEPERVTPALLDALDALTPLAPLHQPHNLAPIRAVAALRPGLQQVACYDTAFHHSMAPMATRLGLPRRYAAEGVRRYGFHGISYEYIRNRLRVVAPDLAQRRVIVAHLGNGASLCAMHNGKSVDTTMGFSTLDGLVMGTRCGTLDPGVVLYLQRQHGLDARATEDLLYHQSGLLGVSGISADMRDLAASPDPAAREAIELFVFRIARETGALTATLGGLDGVVFTGGIGEHDAAVRDAVCARLGWLGPLAVHVIPTDEEAMIGQHVMDMLEAGAAAA